MLALSCFSAAAIAAPVAPPQAVNYLCLGIPAVLDFGHRVTPSITKLASDALLGIYGFIYLWFYLKRGEG